MDTFPYPYTQADAEWWISTGSRLPGVIVRAIDVDGKLAGGVGIKLQSGWRSHLGEVGYWVGRSLWRQGIGGAAVTQVTDLGFNQHGFDKLYAPVMGPNSASMALLTRCGYVREAIMKNEVKKNGRLFDIHQFARYRT